jgi:hypothetical protein
MGIIFSRGLLPRNKLFRYIFKFKVVLGSPFLNLAVHPSLLGGA